MKTIYRILLLLVTLHASSQTVTIKGRILDEQQTGPFPGLSVSLVKDNRLIANTQTDYDGNYSLQAPPGSYELRLEQWGYADKIILVEATDGTKTVDSFYPDPCVDSAGICPYHHTDGVIPIIYGYPSRKSLRMRKRGKIALGGCFEMCPKWYCKKHHVSF